MGVSILIGSLIGGLGSKSMSDGGINLIYGILALTAAVMMFIPKKGLDDIPLEQVKFNKWLAAALFNRWGWVRDSRGSRCLFISADYACCLKNSNPNDNCIIISDYFYFFHWSNSW